MSVPSDRRIVAHSVGPHRIDVEFPDVVHIHYDGEVRLAHFVAFDEIIKASLPPSIPLYLLRDARNGGFVAAETRKHIVTKPKESFQAVLTYGASFQSKTVFENMNRAIRVMKPAAVQIEFFSTEAEAREWLAKHREAIART